MLSSMVTMDVDRDGIRAAAEEIAPYIRHTPVVDLTGVAAKLELCQHTGSFKARGAFANLLMREVPPAGVVAASGGNHGAAVAYAARTLGHRAKIFVPSYSSPVKIGRIREYGADLVISEDIGQAFAAAESWAAESGAILVPPFDRVETMLGAGTVGMEMQAQAPSLDTILVAAGGGGLIAGVAAWYQGDVRVIGVEPEASPTMFRAFEAGHPVNSPTGGIAADSLSPQRIGESVYPVARRWVERVVLVTDDAIRSAQAHLWTEARIVAEPGGAAAYSALLSRRYVPAPGERVGIVISGGNTVAVDFTR
jgi:threonine dehydratase